MTGKILNVEVNPSVIKWARESAGVGLTQIAKRLGTSEETITAWESGSKMPTLRALETLASFLKRPLSAFFLSTPPI
jgi:transcriptional regulator with XRE-family HTH domain